MSARPEDCDDFGKDWNPNHVMCAGGLDPTYVNPINRTNHRDRCRWFAQCAQRTSLFKLGQKQKQVQVTVPKPQPQQWNPAHALARGVMQGAGMAPMPPMPQMPVQVRPNPQQVAPQVQQSYAGAMAPPAVAGMPMAVPMNHAAYGAQMPAYLTVPEPVLQGQHWGKRLAYTLIRSMAKAGGHSTANFFDHMTFNPYPVYPQPPPPYETGQS